MIPFFFASLLVACGAENDLEADRRATAEDGIAPGTLRVDTRPSADDLALLPQSFLLSPGWYEGVDVFHELHGTVVVSGTLTAEIMQGFAVASGVRPLDGLVRARRDGLLQGGAAQTGADGAFSFSLPGSQPYALELIPADPTMSPLAYFGELLIDQGLQLNSVIAMGAPVYGRVTDAEGNRLAKARLHIRRADVDARSSTFTTDDQGWYLARVEPGYSYVIETEGGTDADARPYPVVAAEFTVENGEGAEVNLDVGVRSVVVTLDADFTDADGAELRTPQVRATSSALETGSLVVEKTGDSDGHVVLNMLPGTWTIEVWPAIGQAGLTPWVLRDYVVEADEYLGRLALSSPTTLAGTIFDANGSPLAGTTVTATELGAGGYNYSTTSDSKGAYELAVPRTTLRLQAVPSSPDAGAYAHTAVDLTDAGAHETADLDLLPGTVLSGVASLDGDPVPFALIDVYDHVQGLLLGTTVTDGDGAYTVRVDVRDVEAATDADDADTGEEDTGDGGDTAE